MLLSQTNVDIFQWRPKNVTLWGRLRGRGARHRNAENGFHMDVNAPHAKNAAGPPSANTVFCAIGATFVQTAVTGKQSFFVKFVMVVVFASRRTVIPKGTRSTAASAWLVLRRTSPMNQLPGTSS